MRRLALLALLLAPACTTPMHRVPADYLAADRATYEAVSDDYLAWIGEALAVGRLTPEEAQRRRLLIESWRNRIEAAEEANAEAQEGS